MPHELEYIVDKAVCHCDKGAAPNFFRGLANQNVKINGCMACTKADKIPIANIPSFGVCSVTGSACTPAPLDWTDTYKVKIKGKETLLFKSSLPCSVGGKIEFMTSGQVPVTEEELANMTDENSEQEEDEGWGWWDTAELIPVVGSVIGIVRSAAKGDWWMAAANVGFLALDIAGVASFGATTAASTAAKGGLKAGLKVAGKAALKSAGKVLTKQGAKALAKGLAKHVDDIAKATGKICVFACFPAGTPVHTVSGRKNIEEIVAGDKVWAWDEDSGTVALKKVTATMQHEVDATVEITLEGETIETTAEHPFYTREGWKDAADLTTGDELKTKEGEWKFIKAHKFAYQKRKVFNFEVEGWHTYFVGVLAWLVHNAPVCLSEMILKSQKWFQNIMRGNSFNGVMNAFTEILAKSQGREFYAELTVKLAKGSKGRIDSLIKGVAMIERKATKLEEVTVKTAKSYIDDAAKYKNAIYETSQGTVKKVTEDIYLHVDEIGNLSQEVLDHAAKKGVKIIDDISQIKFP
jgi:Pretoxin HINT domain/Domain of unknown function (DUF4280)